MTKKTLMHVFLERYKESGNGTEAAMQTFNTPSRKNASAIAHIYLTRAQNMGLMNEQDFRQIIRKRKRITEDPCVYVLKGIAPWYKIGKSKYGPRISGNQTGHPIPLIVELKISTQHLQLETLLHHLFADKRGVGEWFQLSKNDLLTLQKIAKDPQQYISSLFVS